MKTGGPGCDVCGQPCLAAKVPGTHEVHRCEDHASERYRAWARGPGATRREAIGAYRESFVRDRDRRAYGDPEESGGEAY